MTIYAEELEAAVKRAEVAEEQARNLRDNLGQRNEELEGKLANAGLRIAELELENRNLRCTEGEDRAYIEKLEAKLHNHELYAEIAAMAADGWGDRVDALRSARELFPRAGADTLIDVAEYIQFGLSTDVSDDLPSGHLVAIDEPYFSLVQPLARPAFEDEEYAEARDAYEEDDDPYDGTDPWEDATWD